MSKFVRNCVMDRHLMDMNDAASDSTDPSTERKTSLMKRHRLHGSRGKGGVLQTIEDQIMPSTEGAQYGP